MGIRSYVRDRKQVKASRAGEAREKLSDGDYSIFGGKNGASIDPWDPDVDISSSKNWGPQPSNNWAAAPKSKSEVETPHYPKNGNGDWFDNDKDQFADMPHGRKDRFSTEPETPGEEAERGARMPGPGGVTVLGPKYGGANPTGERMKIDGETRGRVRASNLEARRKGESSENEDDYLPTLEDVERVKREDSTPKPKPRLKAWDEDL